MSEKYFHNFSDDFSYSYLFFGGGSFICLVASPIYNIPALSVLFAAILWGIIYFLPRFNEIRNRAKYGKKTEEGKIVLVLSGIGIYVVAILAYCFFVLDYKLYYRNQNLILGLYTIIVMFMLYDAVMKLSGKIKGLEYKFKLKKKTVISIIFVVIQFVLFLYPIYDHIKSKNTYSLPSIKVANSARVSEVNSLEDKKSPLIANINELPSYISEVISNKPSKNLAFLEAFRIELEQQREKYYEVVFDYKSNEGNKDENEVYASSLKVFMDRPIVIATLKSYDKDLNKLSKHNYKVEIELSEEEYMKVRDYVADISNVKR
jgi:hypothetical protein